MSECMESEYRCPRCGCEMRPVEYGSLLIDGICTVEYGSLLIDGIRTVEYMCPDCLHMETRKFIVIKERE